MTQVTIGSNNSIATVTPSSSSGSGPYVVGFSSSPGSSVGVGDLFAITDATEGDYLYLLTGINGSSYTLKYISGGSSSASPFGIVDEYGDQEDGTFKRAFSTIVAFEEMTDDSSPSYWGSTDFVTGVLHADSAFEEERIQFNDVKALKHVTLTVDAGSRHSGAMSPDHGIVATIYPENSTIGSQLGIISLEDTDPTGGFTVEWLQFDLSRLNGSSRPASAIMLDGNSPDIAIIRNNIIHSFSGSIGSNNPIQIHQDTPNRAQTLVVHNNIVHDICETASDPVQAITLNQCKGTGYAYNNTIFRLKIKGSSSSVIAVRYGNAAAGAVAKVKNNIAVGFSGMSAGDNRPFWMTNANGVDFDYNMSDNNANNSYEATGANSLADQNLSSQVKFISTVEDSVDLGLQSDSTALAEGVDLGNQYGVNIDASGVDRTSLDWDMGARQMSESDDGNPSFFLFVS